MSKSPVGANYVVIAMEDGVKKVDSYHTTAYAAKARVESLNKGPFRKRRITVEKGKWKGRIREVEVKPHASYAKI